MPGPTLGLLVRPDVAELATSPARRRFAVDFARCGQIAETLSFDELWLEEPPSPATPSVGPFALLGHLAACTTLAIGAVLPATAERIPSITAKLIASLDVVTTGRTMLALAPSARPGAGPAKFTPRDLEAVRIVDTLLREQAPSVAGDYYAIEQAWNEPRAAGRPTPLFLVVEQPGATRDAPVRREFVPYRQGREDVTEVGGAAEAPALGPSREVVAVDADSTPAMVATSLSRGGARVTVFAWQGPLDPARLEALFATVLGH